MDYSHHRGELSVAHQQMIQKAITLSNEPVDEQQNYRYSLIVFALL